jgi:hypothetical protein
MTLSTSPRSERGTALVTVLLLMMLAVGMLAGFTTTLINDNRLRGFDRTRTQAFYGAHGALEQLTADLGNLFTTDFAPTAEDILALTDEVPEFDDVELVASDGTPGYAIDFDEDADGNPVSETREIDTGLFEGFTGLITPFTLTVTARTPGGAEVELRRVLQTVSIPVFQFGLFSETDLSFFAGPTFNFGGRVHTNGNLFLASGSTLTLSDRVTAVDEVIRTNLSNGWATSGGYTGNVRLLTAPGTYRNLASGEGSLVGTLGSAENEPTWTDLYGTYNGYLLNGRTGARELNLPFVSLGATPVDLIRRGVTGEDDFVLSQRYYSLASLRILLSDTAADITGLPGVTADAPLPLENLVTNPIAGYVVDATHAPLALSSGVAAEGYRSPVDTGLLGGFIKIELQTADEAWQDVTLEILNLGIAGRNLNYTEAQCAPPAPDAIVRLQRVKNAPVGGALGAGGELCGTGSTLATDYWPNVLYDPREGNFRDNIATGTTTMFLGGVMHYIELDVRNLSRWFDGAIGASGGLARDVNGYTVYFSDRRTNRNAANQETGEYGYEDFVNPASAAGTPNTTLDTGEDVNQNGTLETYGETPIVPVGGTAPLDATARPTTSVTAAEARANRAVLFRRALKLTNGSLGNLVMPGLTIVVENPIYIQGNYNADATGFGAGNAAAAVIGDAVTFLSNSWNDTVSLTSPHSPAGRVATTTWYRTAILSGKGPSFPRPGTGGPQDFGTDGGVHNFLRYIERWSGQTLNYLGSIASFYYNRQAVGTYKCCSNVYSPPTRAYTFDTNFLTPALLPPMTPMFRDVNATEFELVTQ